MHILVAKLITGEEVLFYSDAQDISTHRVMHNPHILPDLEPWLTSMNNSRCSMRRENFLIIRSADDVSPIILESYRNLKV